MHILTIDRTKDKNEKASVDLTRNEAIIIRNALFNSGLEDNDETKRELYARVCMLCDMLDYGFVDDFTMRKTIEQKDKPKENEV